MESLDQITRALGCPKALWTLHRGSQTVAAVARWRHSGAVIDLVGADAYQVIFNLSGGQVVELPNVMRSCRRTRAGSVGINFPEAAGVIKVHGQADTLQMLISPELIERTQIDSATPTLSSGAPRPELQSASVQALVALQDCTGSGQRELERIVLETAKYFVTPSILPARMPQGGLSPSARRRVSALSNEWLTDPAKPAPRVKDLAEAAGVSLYHFIRAHRRTEGQTPHARLIVARINRALELLLRTETSINWISDVTRFASSSHFVSAFKTHMGVTPGVFRRAAKCRS